ncbi:unnamed protein product [Closterium sp. NIES-53]
MSHLPQGNLLPLIRAGDIVSIWHDVILFASPGASNSPRRAPPRAASASAARGKPATAIPLLNFICTSSKSSSFAASLAGRRRRLALDGAVRVDDSEQRPWNLGIIPQTCVLGPSPVTSATSPSSALPDKSTSAADVDLYPLDSSAVDPSDPFSRPDDCGEFPVILDNAPMEAVEVGAKERDPGDVFPVLPLLALPVRLRSGLGTEVSWKLVVVAADDPLVLANQVATIVETILPRVIDWAAGGFGGFAGGSKRVDSDRWWIPESPRRESDDWEEATRKAQGVVLEAHSIWKLLVPSLRRPTLQRRQRVSERTLDGWRDKRGAGDDDESNLLKLIARPGASGGLGGFGGGKSRGSGGKGREGSGAVAGGMGGLSRGRCSAAAAAAAVAAVEGRSALNERDMVGGEGEEAEGREGEGTRQLRRTASVEDSRGSGGRNDGGRSNAESNGSGPGGGKRRGVLPQISPRSLSMTTVARALVKTATWSRASSLNGTSSSGGTTDGRNDGSDSISPGSKSFGASAGNRGFTGNRGDEETCVLNRSKTCNGADAASTRVRPRSKSPLPRPFANRWKGSPPDAPNAHFDDSSLGHGGDERRRGSAGRVTSIEQTECAYGGFRKSGLADELGEIDDTSDLGEAVKGKTDPHGMWNSGRLGLSFGSKSGDTSTRPTSSKAAIPTWGGLGSGFYSGPVFGRLGKSRTIKESDGQPIEILPSRGWQGNVGSGDGGEGDYGVGGGNCFHNGDGSGYGATSGGGERVRSGARGAFSRSNTASSTYSFVSMGSMASSHSSRCSKSPAATPDLAAATANAFASGYHGADKSHRVDRLVLGEPSRRTDTTAGTGGTDGRSRPFTPPMGRSKTEPKNCGSGRAGQGRSCRVLSPTDALDAAASAHNIYNHDSDEEEDDDDDNFAFSQPGGPDSLTSTPGAKGRISPSPSPLPSPPVLTRRWSLTSRVSSTGEGAGGQSGRNVFDASAGAERREVDGRRGSRGRDGGQEATEWAAEEWSDDCSSQASSSHTSVEPANSHYGQQLRERRMLPKLPTLPKSPSLPKSPALPKSSTMPKSPSLPKSPAHPKSSTLPKSPSLPKSPYAEKNGLRRGVRMERPHPPDSNPMRACESSVGGSSMGVPSEVPQTRGGTRRGVRGKQRGQQQLVPESFSTESEVSMRSMSPGSNMLARSVSCDQPSPQAGLPVWRRLCDAACPRSPWKSLCAALLTLCPPPPAAPHPPCVTRQADLPCMAAVCRRWCPLALDPSLCCSAFIPVTMLFSSRPFP